MTKTKVRDLYVCSSDPLWETGRQKQPVNSSRGNGLAQGQGTDLRQTGGSVCGLGNRWACRYGKTNGQME